MNGAKNYSVPQMQETVVQLLRPLLVEPFNRKVFVFVMPLHETNAVDATYGNAHPNLEPTLFPTMEENEFEVHRGCFPWFVPGHAEWWLPHMLLNLFLFCDDRERVGGWMLYCPCRFWCCFAKRHEFYKS